MFSRGLTKILWILVQNHMDKLSNALLKYNKSHAIIYYILKKKLRITKKILLIHKMIRKDILLSNHVL